MNPWTFAIWWTVISSVLLVAFAVANDAWERRAPKHRRSIQ